VASGRNGAGSGARCGVGFFAFALVRAHLAKDLDVQSFQEDLQK